MPAARLRAATAAIALRGRHLLVLDVAATALSFLLAFALRFDAPSALFDSYVRGFLWALPLLIVVRLAVFLWLRLYQQTWRYASVEELISVVGGVLVSSLAGYAAIYGLSALLGPQLVFPRSVPVIEGVLAVAFAGAWRFAFRIFGVGRVGARAASGAERALVVGAGPAAIAVVRELRQRPDFGLQAVGALVDDLTVGQRFLGLEVLGPISDLARIIKDRSIEVVLLALPSASGRTLRQLVRTAETAGARCLTVPGVAEVVAGRVSLDRLREVDVEDLLRRSPARIDVSSVSQALEGARVLITGAGGSIGSELARQIVAFRPRELVLLGRGENSIFETMQSLEPADAGLIRPVILDIRERARLVTLFDAIRPDTVFHAAAHKHVFFMEQFPEEAIATNVIGTVNLLDAAVRSGVDRFVHISSDKAVNPTSVMGATKRVAELLVQEAAVRGRVRYANVRFGNVLSSRGSVVPIFKRQLERGGPLTVTHPDVERFFMTIPEAVQLVLQAAVLAHPGDTFVLDMGDPVKIVDLATDLIALHGMGAEDVQIDFVGLKPGEKLHEELLFPFERTETTSHEAVLRVIRSAPAPERLDSSVAELGELIGAAHRSRILAQLQRIVPDYRPADEQPAKIP